VSAKLIEVKFLPFQVSEIGQERSWEKRSGYPHRLHGGVELLLADRSLVNVGRFTHHQAQDWGSWDVFGYPLAHGLEVGGRAPDLFTIGNRNRIAPRAQITRSAGFVIIPQGSLARGELVGTHSAGG